MKKTIAVASAIACFAVAPSFADHGNPWAGPEDEVNSQFHEENQEKSLNTPGEDEMRGNLVRSAFGKTGGTAGKGGRGQGGRGVDSPQGGSPRR